MFAQVEAGSYLWIEMNDKKFKVWEGKNKDRLKADINLDHNVNDEIKQIVFDKDPELTPPKVYSFLGKVFTSVL